MAKIGLNNFRYAKIKSETSDKITYEEPKKPGKAVSCNVSLTTNDASLYADDGLAETDKSTTGGSVTMGVDELDYKTQEDLLGHKVSEEQELTASIYDVAPYVGLGRIVTKMIEGKYRYVVKFLSKVKFAEPNDEDTTKGNSTTFGTYELPGTIAIPENGVWKKEKSFDTKAEAITYLEGLFTQE